MHFFKRLLHTTGLLLSKPGYLSAAYKKGNNAAYLSPLLLYLFITGLFFAIFITGFRNQTISFGKPDGKNFVKKSTLKLLKEGYKNAKTREDSATIEKTIRSFEDSAGNEAVDMDDDNPALGLFDSFDTAYKTLAAYDSAQQLLPAEKRDGWYEKQEKRGQIAFNERYRNNSRQFWLDITNKFIHYFPYLIFMLLPLYALFFKLVYIRRRQFFFSDHCVFLEHNYTFLFILMLFYLGVLALRQYTTEERLIFTAMVILIVGCIYALRAMKKFYEQTWGKTILKFILLNILCIAVLFAAFMISFLISVSGY
jgi:hypothetical protein